MSSPSQSNPPAADSASPAASAEPSTGHATRRVYGGIGSFPPPASTTGATDAAPGGAARPRPAITWRSLLLGLVGVLFICGLTPYNDYAVNSTFLVGNFLPVGLLMVFIGFTVVINGPLNKYAPRYALGTPELVVAFAMALVSCGLPSSGLMRYLPASLVGMHYRAVDNTETADVLRAAGLPRWLFPDSLRENDGDVIAIGNDPVVRNFLGRVPIEDESFVNRLAAVPWEAWLTPALTWGILLAFMLGMVLCLSVVVRRQWVDNERLPFPLAEVYLSLLEQPRPGRALNDLLSQRWFWIAAASVFCIHSLNAANQYFPSLVPAIPLGFNFYDILGTEPWRFTDWGFKAATVYFCVIGLVYFLQTGVSFSLWFFFLALQVVHMIYGGFQSNLSEQMRREQLFGGVVAYAIALVWVGRAQWWLVLRHMIGRAGPDEPQGRYMPYVLAGWGLIGCALGIYGWLIAVGCAPVGSAVLVGLLMMLFLVMARIVAETGLPFVQLNTPLTTPWAIGSGDLGLSWWRTSIRTIFMHNWFFVLFTSDMREAPIVYATHALRVADQGAYSQERTWRRAIGLTVCLAGALAIGFVVSGASMLFVEYSYAATLDRENSQPLNGYATESQPKNLINATRDFIPPNAGSKEVHSQLGHFTFGALFTSLLSWGRLRFPWWPLHPVGFLMVYGYPMLKIWFSVFLGWLCKAMVVRFGGTNLFRELRPLFVGLILGEASAVAFWLTVSLLLNASGMEYLPVQILPT